MLDYLVSLVQRTRGQLLMLWQIKVHVSFLHVIAHGCSRNFASWPRACKNSVFIPLEVQNNSNFELSLKFMSAQERAGKGNDKR